MDGYEYFLVICFCDKFIYSRHYKALYEAFGGFITMSNLDLLKSILGPNVLEAYPIFLKDNGYVIEDDLIAEGEIDKLKKAGFKAEMLVDGKVCVELGFDAEIRKALKNSKIKPSSNQIKKKKEKRKN